MKRLRASGAVPLRGTGTGQIGRGIIMAGSAALLAGCITVNAPDRPIEINLNIKISQEVVYRFDGDAKKLIEENADIF